MLIAVKALARAERRSAGAVISELARTALTGGDLPTGDDFFGFATIPRRGVVVSAELVDRLIEESGE